MKKLLLLFIPLMFLFSCEKDDSHGGGNSIGNNNSIVGTWLLTDEYIVNTYYHLDEDGNEVIEGQHEYNGLYPDEPQYWAFYQNGNFIITIIEEWLDNGLTYSDTCSYNLSQNNLVINESCNYVPSEFTILLNTTDSLILNADELFINSFDYGDFFQLQNSTFYFSNIE